MARSRGGKYCAPANLRHGGGSKGEAGTTTAKAWRYFHPGGKVPGAVGIFSGADREYSCAVGNFSGVDREYSDAVRIFSGADGEYYYAGEIFSVPT